MIKGSYSLDLYCDECEGYGFYERDTLADCM